MELRHVKTFEGSPTPSDIFQPHMPGVELLSDMDELFRMARGLAATGEYPAATGELPAEGMPAELAALLEACKGQSSVVVVTPGRIFWPFPVGHPGRVRDMYLKGPHLLPPEPPLNVSVISYTYLPALLQDTKLTRAIPFLGHLAAFAAVGHTVVVFEGHPSAFESGVRDSDVLLVDSGMLPFIQKDWAEAALRVMRPGARIFVHDRETYRLRELVAPGDGGPVPPRPRDAEAQYVHCLVALLLMGTRPSAQVTSGEPLPKLSDFGVAPEQLAQLGAPSVERYEMDADKVIDHILRLAGWHSYSVFKKTGKLDVRQPAAGPRAHWVCYVKLDKLEGGRRRVVIER